MIKASCSSVVIGVVDVYKRQLLLKGDEILKYRRVLLKFSGEALAGSKPSGIDFDEVLNFAKEIKEMCRKWN